MSGEMPLFDPFEDVLFLKMEQDSEVTDFLGFEKEVDDVTVKEEPMEAPHRPLGLFPKILTMKKEALSIAEEPLDFSFYLAQANLLPRDRCSRQKHLSSSNVQNTKANKNNVQICKKEDDQIAADCGGKGERAIHQIQNQGSSLADSGLVSEAPHKHRDSTWKVSSDDRNCENSLWKISNSQNEDSVDKIFSSQIENGDFDEKMSNSQIENEFDEKMSNSHSEDSDIDEKMAGFQEEDGSFGEMSKFLEQSDSFEKMSKCPDIKSEQVEKDLEFVDVSASKKFDSNDLESDKYSEHSFKNNTRTMENEYKSLRKHGKGTSVVFKCSGCDYECKKMSTLSRHLFVDHSNSSVPLISEDIYKFEENATVTTRLVGHNCKSPCGKDDTECPSRRITYEPKKMPNRYQRQVKWTIQEKKELLYWYYYSRYEYWSRQKCDVLKEMIDKSDLPQIKKAVPVSKMHSLVSQIYRYLAYKDIEDIKENALKRARDDYFERQEEEMLEVKRKHWSREQKWVLLWAIEYAMQAHSCQSACRLEWRRIFDHFCPEKKAMTSCNLMTQKNNFRRLKSFTNHEFIYMKMQVRHLIETGKNPLTHPIPFPVKPPS